MLKLRNERDQLLVREILKQKAKMLAENGHFTPKDASLAVLRAADVQNRSVEYAIVIWNLYARCYNETSVERLH